MPFDANDPRRDNGDDYWFIIKTLQADVPRGDRVSVAIDGESIWFVARENIAAGVAITFVIGSTDILVTYEPTPGEVRRMQGHR